MTEENPNKPTGELTPAEQKKLDDLMENIPKNIDAIFLPGKINRSDTHLMIIWFDPDKRRMEVGNIDADGVMEAYREANGNADDFCTTLLNKHSSEQTYESYGTPGFRELAQEFHNADYFGVWTDSDGSKDEMTFIVNWASMYKQGRQITIQWKNSNPNKIFSASGSRKENVCGSLIVGAKERGKNVGTFIVDIRYYYRTKRDSGYELEIYTSDKNFSCRQKRFAGLKGIKTATDGPRFISRSSKLIAAYIASLLGWDKYGVYNYGANALETSRKHHESKRNNDMTTTIADQKRDWLVGICDSDGNRIFLSSVRGTKDDVKKYLLRLAQEQARIEYVEGSGVVNDVPESENDIQEITYDDGTTVLNTGCEYGDHHCIITAEPEKQPLDLTDIPEQTGTADDPDKTKPMPESVYEAMIGDIRALLAHKDNKLSDKYDVYSRFLRGRMNLQFCLCGEGTRDDPLYVNPELYVLGDEYDYGDTESMNYGLVEFHDVPKAIHPGVRVEDDPDDPRVYVDLTSYLPDFITADEITKASFKPVSYEEFCDMAAKLLADIAKAYPKWDEDMTERWEVSADFLGSISDLCEKE